MSWCLFILWAGWAMGSAQGVFGTVDDMASRLGVLALSADILGFLFSFSSGVFFLRSLVRVQSALHLERAIAQHCIWQADWHLLSESFFSMTTKQWSRQNNSFYFISSSPILFWSSFDSVINARSSCEVSERLGASSHVLSLDPSIPRSHRTSAMHITKKRYISSF